MIEAAKQLYDMMPQKDYLLAIDSDGCVFDAMGIKQRECFCPWYIAYFGLQPVAEAARECKDFADLFSKTRGANRHKTVARILTELLPSHPQVLERGFKVPDFRYYIDWVNDSKSMLSDSGLKAAFEQAPNEEARLQFAVVLAWSKKVNEAVAAIVKNVSPFPNCKVSLDKAIAKADIMVCSSTPGEALHREWAEHGVDKYVRVIAGQEMGKKSEHLAIMAQKYNSDKILMIGDAPGDQDAAEANGLLFYPINPGHETASLKRFHDEAFEKFINGEYEGSYQKKVVEEFQALLPERPVWMA